MADIYDFNELRSSAEKIAVHSIQSVLAQQVSKRRNVYLILSLTHWHATSKVYESSRVAGWSDEVTRIAVEELMRVSTNFKYAISCVILEKKGAGVDTAAT